MSKTVSRPNSGTKPGDKPKPIPVAVPQASVPPKLRGIGSRPFAAAPAQRAKRKAKRPAGTLTAKVVSATEGELMLYGSIGEDWYGEGITDKSFNESLKSLGKVDTINLRINSGGGDVFMATAIYNMLVKHEAKVIVYIEGVAASAATLIAMAGDEIHISENAHFMVHAASGIAWGNAAQLRQYLKLLDNADELLRLTYSRRTGLDVEELVEMMAFDNWMTATKAHEHGFVDIIDEAKSVSPHVTPESKSSKHPKVILTEEKLAAFSGYLETLSAAVRPSQVASNESKAGDTPPNVNPVQKEKTQMKLNAALRAKCVSCGMPSGLTDEQESKWFDDNADKVLATKAETTVSDVGGIAANVMDIIEKRDKVRADARKAWKKEVDNTIQLAFGTRAPDGLRDECYELQDDGKDKLTDRVLAAKQKSDTNDGGVRISYSDEQPRENHVKAIRAGVMVRCMRNFTTQRDAKLTASQVLEKHLPEKDRPKGWEDFSQMPLVKIAEECLLADGYTDREIRRLAAPQIAQAALGFSRNAGIRALGAVHTTGSLAEITRDAINKSLLAGFEEAPQTWRGPGRQAASVSDFKQIHRIKLGASPNLPVWNDNQAPEEAKLSNEKESYAVEARAEVLKFSWRLVVNDDLDALSRRPQLMGDAAGRTVNAVFWQQVTSNPVMSDGQALFLETPTGNRKRSNYITGSASPTNTTIGSMRKLMRLMRGLNTPEGAESDDVLNLMPAYIVGPAALEEIILKQVRSSADPASGGNSGVYNSSATLEPVIEPLLDADSATGWYLFASPGAWTPSK